MRLFVGMPVPGHDRLRSLTPEVEQAGFRPVIDGTWHITLRFLGDARPEPVAAALQEALPGEPGMDARIGGLGAFSDPRRAHIVWAGVEAPGIGRLAEQVVAATRTLGAPPKRRAFRPHVTLGRARGTRDARDLVARHAGTLATGRLDKVVLYASTRTPEGAHHVPVGSWHLA